MRYPNIFGHVDAQPDAKPTQPLVLDDSNSDLDPWEQVRKPKQEYMNRRHYAVAESTTAVADESADE